MQSSLCRRCAPGPVPIRQGRQKPHVSGTRRTSGSVNVHPSWQRAEVPENKRLGWGTWRADLLWQGCFVTGLRASALCLFLAQCRMSLQRKCRVPKGTLSSVKACCFSVKYCHTTSLKLMLSRTICSTDMIPQIKQLVKKKCAITFLKDHTCDFHYWWTDISVDIWPFLIDISKEPHLWFSSTNSIHFLHSKTFLTITDRDFYPTVKAALRHESADSEEDRKGFRVPFGTGPTYAFRILQYV